jgi:hypothetical protein
MCALQLQHPGLQHFPMHTADPPPLLQLSCLQCSLVCQHVG